jgi:hypothetical protein
MAGSDWIVTTDCSQFRFRGQQSNGIVRRFRLVLEPLFRFCGSRQCVGHEAVDQRHQFGRRTGRAALHNGSNFRGDAKVNLRNPMDARV